MKNLYYIAATLSMIVVSSCMKEPQAILEPDAENSGQLLVKKTFTAYVEDDETDSKVILYSGNKTQWEADDAISVFVDNNPTNYRFVSTGAGSTTGFEGTIPDGESYIAVYPYSDDIVYDSEIF